jgi:hypothetical protein
MQMMLTDSDGDCCSKRVRHVSLHKPGTTCCQLSSASRHDGADVVAEVMSRSGCGTVHTIEYRHLHCSTLGVFFAAVGCHAHSTWRAFHPSMFTGVRYVLSRTCDRLCDVSGLPTSADAAGGPYKGANVYTCWFMVAFVLLATRDQQC